MNPPSTTTKRTRKKAAGRRRAAAPRRPDSAPTQVARLLSLLPYLRTHPSVRVADVAAMFGVSERQIIQDLRVLWFTGLPGLQMGDYIEVDMEAVEGDGVIHVANADYLARPLRLRTDEAVALLVALRTMAAVPGSDAQDAIGRAITKLEVAAGESATRAATVQVQVDGDAVADVATDIRRALTDGKRLHLTYWVPSRDEATERDVDPMRLIVVDGRLYLEGWCRRAESTRLFRLDRILALTVLELDADVPPDVRPRDLDAGLFQPGENDERVVLDVTRRGRWIADYYPVESVEELPDFGLRVAVRVHDRQWIRRLVLRLGGAGRVVEPADLDAEIRAEARAALDAYLT